MGFITKSIEKAINSIISCLVDPRRSEMLAITTNTYKKINL